MTDKKDYKIIRTKYANFRLLPYNQYILPDYIQIIPYVFDTANEIDCMRIIRLLLFCGYKEIYVHTQTYENENGWKYSLNMIHNDDIFYRIQCYCNVI